MSDVADAAARIHGTADRADAYLNARERRIREDDRRNQAHVDAAARLDTKVHFLLAR
ncbi:MAG TPA: hypothetical protein VFE60_28605 [Roseiarcus sp.]|nr:hypothetical protein [Roseiarcus sp.]